MSDVSHKNLEPLLQALSGLGLAEEAAKIRSEFVSKQWVLSESDVERLQRAVSRGLAGQLSSTGSEHRSDRLAPESKDEVAGPSNVASSSGARTNSSETGDPRLRPVAGFGIRALSHFEPFLCTLSPHGAAASRRILASTNALLAAERWRDFTEAVRLLVTRELRFDEIDPVNERARLPQLSTFQHIERVAEFDDLRILVVEDTYGGPHSSAYNPLFQLHQRVVVFALHPGLQRIRVVVRGTDRICEYVTLVGRAAERRGDENLLTIARRFALLAPSGRETAKELERHWRGTLLQPVADLQAEWFSGPFDADVPGPTWTQLVLRERDGFLQKELVGSARLHWGLHAVLRNRFPLPACKGQARIHLEDWTVIPPAEGDRLALLASATTRAAVVKLALRVAWGEGFSSRFEVETELPLPDSKGEFVIDGTPLRLHLGGPAAQVETSSDWDAVELEEDEEDDNDPQGEATARVGTESKVDDSVAGGEPHSEDGSDGRHSASPPEKEEPAGSRGAMANRQVDARGAPTGHSLEALLAHLVDRRLSNIARTLWNASVLPTSRVEFLRATRSVRARSRPFCLLSLGRLWHYVRTQRTLDEVPFPVVRHAGLEPPSWACLDAWSSEDPDTWIPVSGARLHPCGWLALPCAIQEGAGFLLKAAPQSVRHPREFRHGEAGPAAWWLSEPLTFFAGSAAGEIELPLHRTARTFEREAVRIHGEKLRVLASRSAWTRLARCPIQSLRVRTVPAPLGDSSPVAPELALVPGQSVPRSAVWLRVPRPGWQTRREPRHRHLADQVRSRLSGGGILREETFELRLGPDEYGVVTHSAISALPGPSGALIGWRAFAALSAPARAWLAALPDGRTVNAEVVDDHEMPFDADGEAIDIVVIDPKAPDEGATWLFDGGTGETLGAGSPLPVLIACLTRLFESCPPDAWLRYKLLDGDGIPADGSAPQLTDTHRLWLAQAHPDRARACDVAERRANADEPPFLARFLQLLEDVGSLETPSTEQTLAPFDPTLGRLPIARRTLDGPPSAAFEFRCKCGSAQGASRAGLRCLLCRERVRRLVGDRTGPLGAEVRLPGTYLHPWSRRIAAAWAGLLPDELDKLLGTVSVEQYLAHLLSLPDPLEPASVRLRDGTLSMPRANTLRANLQELVEELGVHGSPEALSRRVVVQTVREPRALVDLCGQPAGSWALQAPSLLANVRQLRAAVRLYEDFGRGRVGRVLAYKLVDEALRRVLGEGDEVGPGWTSYRAALLRQLPCHRTGETHHVVPGLFRSGDPKDAPDAFLPFGAAEALMKTDLPRGELAVLAGEEVVSLPRPEWRGGRGSSHSLREQLALQTLVRRHLIPVAALGVACEALAWSPGELTELGVVCSLDGRNVVGQQFLRSLWALLESADSRPSGMLGLLRATSRELAPDWREAEGELSEEISRWLPERSGPGAFVRSVLARVLSGFSRSKSTASETVTWTGERQELRSRLLPSLDSGAWRALPGTAALLSPLAWIQQGASLPLGSVVLSQLLRWGEYPVALPLHGLSRPSPAPAHPVLAHVAAGDDAPPSPTPAVADHARPFEAVPGADDNQTTHTISIDPTAPSADVRMYPYGLATWISRV